MKKFPSLKSRLFDALIEDGAFADLTTRAVPGTRKKVSAALVCKASGIFSGSQVISTVFGLLDRKARVRVRMKDGARVGPNMILATISATEDAILAGERLVLNLVCHLSGVATLTRRYVDSIRGTGASILDTRKTTPLWRDLERDAVRHGGGLNHRASLATAVLAKDNHWRLLASRGLTAAEVYGPSGLARQSGAAFVAIEAANLEQVWEAVRASADIILLDNMAVNRIKEAVSLIRAARTARASAKPLIEVSGGATPASAREWARLGVDRISVGALTHSAPALDISLEVD